MIGVIADIHGNYPALSVVLAELDSLGCTKIISLGDVVGYYCMPNECINELKKRNIIHILGNHDYYLLNNVKCSRSSIVNFCIDYQRKIITAGNKEWLEKSLLFYEDSLISARHGGWNDCLEEYVYTFDFSLANKKQRIFISGHTHIQKLESAQDKFYLNPGSVGQPRDGDKRTAFAVIKKNNNIKLYRKEYNIDSIVDKMKENNFPKKIYEGLYFGKRIGNN